MVASFKTNIWKIYLFGFFANLHFVGGVLIPFFTEWGGLSFTQIMILQSWFLFWAFLLEVPTGTVADYLGRKHSLFLGCIFAAVGALIYGSMPHFYVFLIGEFFFATAAALISGASEAFTYDTLEKLGQSERSKKVFARVKSFSLAGIMSAAPIGSLIAFQFSLRTPMLMLAIPSFIAFVIALTMKEPRAKRKVESTRYLNILKDGVKFFYKNRILKILAADLIFIGSIAYFMIWLYQPMLMKAGVSIAYFGIIHAFFVLSEILVMNGSERLEKIFGSKKRLIFFSSVITGAMFILGGLTAYLPLILLVIFLGGGFGLGREPLFTSYLNKYIPSEKRATVLSSVSMLRKLALVIINPFVGLAVDWSLNYTLIILGILAISFSLVSKVEERHLID